VDDTSYVRAQKELNSELREEEAEAVRETFDKRCGYVYNIIIIIAYYK